MHEGFYGLTRVLVVILVLVYVFYDELRCKLGNKGVCQAIETVYKQGN